MLTGDCSRTCAIAADLRRGRGDRVGARSSSKPFVGTGGTLMLAMGGIKGAPRYRAGHASRRAAGRRGERGHRARRAWRAHVVGPAASGGAQRPRPSWLRPRADRHRPRHRCRRVCRRRRQPLAGRAHPGRGAPVPAGARIGACGLPAARDRRRGRALPRHCRRHRRPSARRACQRASPPGGGGGGWGGGGGGGGGGRSTSGFLGGLVGLDNPTSSAYTRELLGWQPVHAGLIEDLTSGHYFEHHWPGNLDRAKMVDSLGPSPEARRTIHHDRDAAPGVRNIRVPAAADGN